MASLVDALLFRKWGVRAPEEPVDEGMDDVFSDVTAYALYAGNVDLGSRGELALGEIVRGKYFDVMGVEAALGRTFLPEEDAARGPIPWWFRPMRIGAGASPPTSGSRSRCIPTCRRTSSPTATSR